MGWGVQDLMGAVDFDCMLNYGRPELSGFLPALEHMLSGWRRFKGYGLRTEVISFCFSVLWGYLFLESADVTVRNHLVDISFFQRPLNYFLEKDFCMSVLKFLVLAV